MKSNLGLLLAAGLSGLSITANAAPIEIEIVYNNFSDTSGLQLNGSAAAPVADNRHYQKPNSTSIFIPFLPKNQ